VIGAPRSGTTLISTALAAHPSVALLMEDCDGAVFRIAGGKVPAVKLCTPRQIDIDHVRSKSYALVAWNGWLRKHVGRRPPHSRLSLRDMAARAELEVVGILREPAANMRSMQRHERDYSDGGAREVLRRTYDILEGVSSEPRMQLQLVSFDRFVRDPVTQLHALITWLGLRFDDAMLQAPRLNHRYPEATFRADRAAFDAELGEGRDDGALAALRSRYRALLAQAL
jgi:hypothetical protein